MTLDSHRYYLMPDSLRYKAVRAGEGLYHLYASSSPSWAAPKYEMRQDGKLHCRYDRPRICAGAELTPDGADA